MSAVAARSPVVVGIGAGAPDGDALYWGAAEAAARGSSLRLVHAVPGQLVADPWGLLPSADGPRVAAGVVEAALRTCDAALGFAFRAAAQRGIPLVAVHAWAEDAPADLEAVCAAPAVVEAEAEETLDRVLDRWWRAHPDVPVHRRTVHGAPAAALLAASRGAALVVVGCRGRGPVRNWLSGSVSREVARSALAPVAVVGGRCAAQRTLPPEDAGPQAAVSAAAEGPPGRPWRLGPRHRRA